MSDEIKKKDWDKKKTNLVFYIHIAILLQFKDILTT